MSDILALISNNIHYIIPPIIGAFIGYLTNKIAIRMLFRPLKAWSVFGVRVPMTPGVIPSKRHKLAHNIGEMVGGHLLTSKEIGRGLAKESFQQQLRGLIKDRVGGILIRDLPPLPMIIPKKYACYFDIAVKTISYQLKSSFHTFAATQEFEKSITDAFLRGFDELSNRDIDTAINREGREEFYTIIDRIIESMIASQSMEQWLEDFMYGKIDNIIKNEKSLNDILPETLIDLILRSIEQKTPDILERLAALTKEPDIQDKLIDGIKKAVDSFSTTLGPVGGMIQNFLNADTIDKVVKDYFSKNKENISQWLDDKEVQEKFARSLMNRVHHYFNTPLVEFIKDNESFKADNFSKTLSKHLLILLRQEGVAQTVSSMLKENLEEYIDGGNLQFKKIIGDVAGEHGVERLGRWVAEEGLLILRSQESKRHLDRSVDQIISSFISKPLGKLANFIPADVREGMYGSMQKMSSAMLAAEVPGLVDSLNIRHIITEKIDSLDLLRLERLLLSIMEEQFKYINLFGAILGFLIGGLNVVFLLLL